jgi:hypothetical protein
VRTEVRVAQETQAQSMFLVLEKLIHAH